MDQVQRFEEEEATWAVERIIRTQTLKGIPGFWVKWVNLEEPSWIPRENLREGAALEEWMQRQRRKRRPRKRTVKERARSTGNRGKSATSAVEPTIGFRRSERLAEKKANAQKNADGHYG